MTGFPGRIRVVALVLAATMALSTCSDDGGGSEDTSGGDEPPATGAQPATGDPISVGLVNLEGGAISLPEVRIGAEVAADYVNSDLGGVNGRPIEFEVCTTDGSPESSVDCANQLVEAGVALVQVGVDLNGDAMLPILSSAEIPMVGHIAVGKDERTDPNAVFLGASTTALLVAPLEFYAEEGAESISYFLPDVPDSYEYEESVLEPTAEELGLDIETTFYNPTSPDWNVLAATAMSEDPDVIGMPGSPDTDCIGLITALNSTGFDGSIYAGLCSLFITVLGEQASGVNTVSDLWRPDSISAAPAEKQEEIQTYLDEMEEADAGDAIELGFSGFSDVINISRILSTIDGPIDGPAALDAFQATVDLDSFMGPLISCDGSAGAGETACGTGVLMNEVLADGTLSPLTGDFIEVVDLVSD